MVHASALRLRHLGSQHSAFEQEEALGRFRNLTLAAPPVANPGSPYPAPKLWLEVLQEASLSLGAVELLSRLTCNLVPTC